MHLNLFKPYLLSKQNKKANPSFFSSHPCSGQCYYTLPNPLAPPHPSTTAIWPLHQCFPETVLEKVKDNFMATSKEYLLVPYLIWLLYTMILLIIPLFLKLSAVDGFPLMSLPLLIFSDVSAFADFLWCLLSSCPFLKCWCSDIPVCGHPLSPFLPFFWIFHLV